MIIGLKNIFLIKMDYTVNVPIVIMRVNGFIRYFSLCALHFSNSCLLLVEVSYYVYNEV